MTHYKMKFVCQCIVLAACVYINGISSYIAYVLFYEEYFITSLIMAFVIAYLTTAIAHIANNSYLKINKHYKSNNYGIS